MTSAMVKRWLSITCAAVAVLVLVLGAYRSWREHAKAIRRAPTSVLVPQAGDAQRPGAGSGPSGVGFSEMHELTTRPATPDGGPSGVPLPLVSEYGSPTDELGIACDDEMHSGLDLQEVGLPGNANERVEEYLELMRGDHRYFQVELRLQKLPGIRRRLLKWLDSELVGGKPQGEWKAIDEVGLREPYFDAILAILRDEPFAEFRKTDVSVLSKLCPDDRKDVFLSGVMRSPDPWTRAFAVGDLDLKTASPEQIQEIERMALDPDPRVSDAARKRLVEIADLPHHGEAFQLAVTQYDAAMDPGVRAQFLPCICQRPGSAEAVSRLRSILESDGQGVADETLRGEALEMVNRNEIRQPDLLKDVRAALGDPSPRIRSAAIWALASVGGDEDLLLLRDLARREADPNCRVHIGRAIEALEKTLSAGR